MIEWGINENRMINVAPLQLDEEIINAVQKVFSSVK